MKLNLDIICDYLPSDYKARRVGPKNRSLQYQKPLPYTRGLSLERGSLYIAMSKDLSAPPIDGAAMICVGGRIPQGWLSAGAQLLYLEGCEDMASAVRDVFAVFDRFELWDAQLRDELETEAENFNIKRIITLGVEMLRNPISIAQYDLRTRFHCTLQKDGSGAEHAVFCDDKDLPGLLDAETIEKIKEVCESERVITVPYMSNISNIGYNSYCCNLFTYGHFMGCISIQSELRPFRESDFPLADHLFNYLRKAYRIYQYSANIDNSIDVKTVNSLLERKTLSAEECEPFALGSDEYWLFFSLKEKQGERCLPKDYMCETLRSLLPWALHGAVYREEVVGLLKMSRSDREKNENTLGIFNDLLRRMGYFCGVSNEFDDISDALPYFEQAKYTVENAALKGAENTISFFKDCALQFLLSECTGELPRESVYPEGLRALIEHDREKGSEYVLTLDTYLQTECNASRTAELLYIHRSSFNKRMNKIQQMLGVDLDDAGSRLLLRICLHLAGND